MMPFWPCPLLILLLRDGAARYALLTKPDQLDGFTFFGEHSV
jgi:hypothetical protein